MKSNRELTVQSHQEGNQEDCKLERVLSTAKQIRDQTHTHTHNGSNNGQKINNSRTTALEQTAT